MRIWSLHSKYLDSKGLVALWRETLLAKHVLEGKTKGYKNHPQLIRFKESHNPIHAINQYLAFIHEEATLRGYKFNSSKFSKDFKQQTITVTKGQVIYESKHLLKKLRTRDPKKYNVYKNITDFEILPIFKLVDGDIESWEII